MLLQFKLFEYILKCN